MRLDFLHIHGLYFPQVICWNQRLCMWGRLGSQKKNIWGNRKGFSISQCWENKYVIGRSCGKETKLSVKNPVGLTVRTWVKQMLISLFKNASVWALIQSVSYLVKVSNSPLCRHRKKKGKSSTCTFNEKYIRLNIPVTGAPEIEGREYLRR